MAYIISSDAIKETLPGYDPKFAEKFHDISTKLADKKFEKALKNSSMKRVILMSGGSASGKSEYVSEYLKKQKIIISDGTSSSYNRANIKIEKALKHRKKLEIHAVWPTDFATAFEAFFSRDRQFSPEHFYRTHSKSRKTLLRIVRKYPEISITIIVSKYDENRKGQKMEFEVLTDTNRDKLIEFLEKNQYTEEEIKRSQRLYEI